MVQNVSGWLLQSIGADPGLSWHVSHSWCSFWCDHSHRIRKFIAVHAGGLRLHPNNRLALSWEQIAGVSRQYAMIFLELNRVLACEESFIRTLASQSA
jgi:hypothetical protein